jgi:hypothetical protein
VNAKLPAAALAKNDRRVDSTVNSFTLKVGTKAEMETIRKDQRLDYAKTADSTA